jgi:DNA-binding transcriptional MocR family regulator
MNVTALQRPSSLVEGVCQQLAGLIRGDHSGAERWLPAERSLAEQLGVSRTVVREATKRLEQHLFHIEGHGAKTHRHQAAHGLTRVAESGPGGLEGDGGVWGGAAPLAGFLLPQRGDVQDQGDHGRALDHLDQSPW